MSEPEQREYFRINDRLTLDFKRVDDDEFQKLEAVIRYNPSYLTDRACEMRFLDEVMSQKRGEERELYAYMRVIEKKLDMVLSMLGRRSDEHDYKSITNRVSISGSGAKFFSNEPMELRERVEVRLALPIAPFPKMSILCEVVRIEEQPERGKKEWAVAVKFLVLNDTDRDVLINYIFTKEREKLRSDRETG